MQSTFLHPFPQLLTALAASLLQEPRPITPAIEVPTSIKKSRMETKEPKIVVKIPVKPYMQKFLEFYLSKTYELRQDDAYGVFLFVLFQKRPAKGERAGSIKRYTASFDVCGSKHQLRKAGYKGLTNLTTVQFNNFAEAIFKVEWHSFAASYHESEGKSIRQAVDDFMQKFNLTPSEVDPMSLRRSFLRYRQDEEANKLWREKHGILPDQF